MNLRLIGIGVAGLVAAGGGGRLLYDETRLAGVGSITSAQERYRQADAARASRLTLDLATAEGSIAALQSSLTTAETTAEEAHTAVVDLRQRLEAAREDFSTTLAERTQRVEALTGSLEAAETRSAQAEQQLTARAEELDRAQAQIERLTAERERLAARATELDRQATFLSAELKQREAVLSETQTAREAAQKDLSQTRAHLDATQTELADALRRAKEKEAVLKALKDAGVDVARLSGADPMPLVRGFVVRVDKVALPPIVLVHVGSQSGLRAGDRLYVVRKGRRVATLEVDGQDADICTTRIVAGDRGLQLAPRDEVFSWEPER